MAGIRKLLLFLTLFGSLSHFGCSLDGPRSFVRRVKENDPKDDIRRLLSPKTKAGASKRNLENALPDMNNVLQTIEQSMKEHLSRHMSALEPKHAGAAAPPVRRVAAIPSKRQSLKGGDRLLQVPNVTTNSSNATEDTIVPILTSVLTEVLPQIIELVILTLAQAIIDAIIAALSGASALVQPGGRQLQAVNSTKPVATNTTEDTIVPILSEVLTEVLPQIIELVILTLAQAIVDVINEILFGLTSLLQPGGRQLQAANSTKPVATNATEDTIVPILSEVLTEVLPQIVELVINALAQAIIDAILGILSGASIAGESTTPGAPTPESAVVVKGIATNVSASVANATSASGQVSEEDIGAIVADIIPQLVEFAVLSVSDAILALVGGFISNEDILAIVSGYLDELEVFAIDFILSFLGITTSPDTAGSTNTTGFTDVVSTVTKNITVAANAGAVTPDTIEEILLTVLPQIIEAIILIFAQAIADLINEIIFGVSSLLLAGASVVTGKAQSGLDKVNDAISAANGTIASLDLETVKSAIAKFIP